MSLHTRTCGLINSPANEQKWPKTTFRNFLRVGPFLSTPPLILGPMMNISSLASGPWSQVQSLMPPMPESFHTLSLAKEEASAEGGLLPEAGTKPDQTGLNRTN